MSEDEGSEIEKKMRKTPLGDQQTTIAKLILAQNDVCECRIEGGLLSALGVDCFITELCSSRITFNSPRRLRREDSLADAKLTMGASSVLLFSRSRLVGQRRCATTSAASTTTPQSSPQLHSC